MLAKSWNGCRRTGRRAFIITYLVLAPPLSVLWLNTMRWTEKKYSEVAGKEATTLPARAHAPDDELHFQCAKCQATFTKSGEDMEKLMPQALMPEMGLLQLDCPKCKEKASALMQIKCPACGKYYLSAPMVAAAKALKDAREAVVKAGKNPNTVVPAFPPGDVQLKDICTHCKTDRVQWYIDYYKKKDK